MGVEAVEGVIMDVVVFCVVVDVDEGTEGVGRVVEEGVEGRVDG